MRKIQWIPLLMTIFLAAVWGTSFILMDRAGKYFSPLQVATLRMFIAGICLLPFSIPHIKTVSKREWGLFLAIGIIGNLTPAYLFVEAEQVLNHALVGVLNSLVPLFTLIIAWAVFRGKVTGWNVAGIVVGLVGAVALILVGDGLSLEGQWTHWLLVILACVCYATSTNLINKTLEGRSPLQLTAFALGLVSIPSGIYFFSSGVGEAFEKAPETLVNLPGTEGVMLSEAWGAVLAVIILAAVGTSLALVMFNKVIQLSGPIYATSVTYLIPVASLFWGLWDGKDIRAGHFVAMLVIFLGVFLVNRKEKEKKELPVGK